MKKSILRLTTFIVMLIATFVGCDNLKENVKNVHENTIKENKDVDHSNQVYLDDIEYYRKETAITIDSNNQIISAYKVKIETLKEKCKYEYRQSILKLELQNSYMKMKLDEYEPEGKEKWEIFKAEYASQLVALSAEFAGFSEKNKINKNEHNKI